MKFSFTSYYAAANTFITKYFRWFVLLEIAFILLIAWFALLQNAYITIREQGLVGYAQIQTDIETKQQRLKSLERMSTALQAVNTERLRQIDALLPVGLQPTRVIADMHAFADSAHVTIASIDVVQNAASAQTASTSVAVAAGDENIVVPSSIDQSGVSTATITMSVETQGGEYETLKTFLDSLESFVPLLDLNSLNYSPATTSYALQLTTYYIESTQ